jgi:hypothetical protein
VGSNEFNKDPLSWETYLNYQSELASGDAKQHPTIFTGSASGKSSAKPKALNQSAYLVMDIYVSNLDLAFGFFL